MMFVGNSRTLDVGQFKDALYHARSVYRKRTPGLAVLQLFISPIASKRSFIVIVLSSIVLSTSDNVWNCNCVTPGFFCAVFSLPPLCVIFVH